MSVAAQRAIRGVVLNGTGATVRLSGHRLSSSDGDGTHAALSDGSCPMYYKIGGWEGETLEVNCKTLRTWFPPDWDVLKQNNGDFGPPVERKPGVLSRWGKKTQRWYDCIKISGTERTQTR